MIPFKQFIREELTRNTHIEHAEDMMFNRGHDGVLHVLNVFSNVSNMLTGSAPSAVNITVKFDGAPSIVCGPDPVSGEFFVATKSAFSKSRKLNFTDADIDRNHSDEGLAHKLKLALRYLKPLNIPEIWQGDLMFTHDSLTYKTIDGTPHVVFKPNTISYAIPMNSTLSRVIEKAKLGIVFHTSYDSNWKMKPGVNIAAITPSSKVWVRDASYVDASGTVTLTYEEKEKLNKYIDMAQKVNRVIPSYVYGTIENNATYRDLIKKYNNTRIKEGDFISNVANHTNGLILFLENYFNENVKDAKLEATKTKRLREKNMVVGFFRSNIKHILNMFYLYNILISAKNLILYKLMQIKDIGTFIETDSGFKVVGPEGFVAVDRDGNMVKLVDRLEFSRSNFNNQRFRQ